MSKENRHPYLGSPGILTPVVEQFRNKFPDVVNATILKKLSLASKNESVVITTLRFLGFIDEKGGKTDKANEVFLKHNNEEFQTALSKIVEKSYVELFSTHGKDAWALDREKLIGFFKVSYETSNLTAQRQAITFETLASLSGKIKKETVIGEAKKRNTSKVKKTSPGQAKKVSVSTNSQNLNNEIGLTVRIEINLPAQGDQETYDRIFRSIRENLLK
jgi:hypothetical protein